MPCPGGSGVIGGRVFGDFNYNGLDDQVGPLPDVKVYLFGCDADGGSILLDSTVTDALGHYFFEGLTDGQSYRLEFVPPAGLGYIDAPAGADHGGSVQLVTAPSCEAHAAFTHPEDYALPDPDVAATCFVNGDPLPAASESYDQDVLVMFNWTASGNSVPPDHIASAGQIGACYGLAWDRHRRWLYSSAFVKRHVGLGPLGLGGIYRIDLADPAHPLVFPLVDLEALGVDCGTLPSNADRGLPLTLDGPSNDPEAYAGVGKQGLGGLEYDPATGLLWVVNLYNGKLYSLHPDSDGDPATPPAASDLTEWTLPDAGCSGGSFRPFAVKVWRHAIYVGGVCDAAVSQDTADLEAVVFRLAANGTFEEVVRFGLSYPKGYASNANDCEDFPGWYPWSDQTPPTCDAGATYVYPQPVLSDIAFDVDGSMILGFMDRAGHQLGNKNWPPVGTSPLMSNISGGDMLRLDYVDGTWVLEHNGTAGGITTEGADNGQGPGGGEYYFQDFFKGPADNIPTPPHAETAQGDLAFWPGAGKVATTALDPYSTLFNSGGINWMDNLTGEVQLPGYVLYRSSTSTISTFSKANGLGAIEALVMGTPPVAVGGFVWHDLNNDGVQDPCEPPFEHIELSLYDSLGQLVAATQTDADGRYTFLLDSLPAQKHYLVAGTGGQFDPTTGLLYDTFYITQANTGMAPQPDKNDSDALPAGLQANGAFAGMPFIAFTPSGAGYTNYDLDFGFGSEPAHPVAGIGGLVWFDSDGDGIQDAGESGLGGVMVTLYTAEDEQVAALTTQSDGTYFFPNLVGGGYYLAFDAASNSAGLSGLLPSPMGQGDGTDDSDIDPLTGLSPLLEFDPENGDLEVDAGFYLPTGTIAGYVWLDADLDGLQDSGESGVEGVAVYLYESGGTLVAATTSAADGTYAFHEVPAGQYYLHFDPSTNAAGVPNYQFVPQDAGDDALDSDVEPLTGNTPLLAFDPMAGLLELDAGLYEPRAAVQGRVWQDDDRDGLQDAGEPGIEGVGVYLFDESAQLLASATTDAAGNYLFADLPAGNYFLEFDVSTNAAGIADYEATVPNAGNDALDSDIDPATQRTALFSFDPLAGDLEHLDAGYVRPYATVSGWVWLDCDGDGLQDAGEEGLSGVPVTLSGNALDGTTVALSSQTDAAGNYAFVQLPAGTYELTFAAPASPTGLAFSPQNAGDEDVDSDAHPTTGSTGPFTAEGGLVYDFDAALRDTQPPQFDYLPPDETLSCTDPQLADPPLLSATDNLGPVDITFEETTSGDGPGGCVGGLTVVRTWTATDQCGLSTTWTQTLTSGDELAPFILNVPDLTVDCGTDVTENIKVADDCDLAPELSWTDAVLDDGCPRQLWRTYVATDDCGNTRLAYQKLTLVDTLPPAFHWENEYLQGLPPSGGIITLPCHQMPTFEAADISAWDDCAEQVEVSVELVLTDTADCQTDGFLWRQLWQWTLSDPCGNTTTAVVEVRGIDEAPPLLSGVPADLTVSCTDLPAPPAVLATDACGGELPVLMDELVLTDECTYKIVRTWTAVDACGHVAEAQQLITVVDDQPPTLVPVHPDLQGLNHLDSLEVSCAAPLVLEAADVSAIDACSEVSIEFSEAPMTGDCTEGYLVRLRCCWTATDACGNASEFCIVVRVVDEEAPTLEAPPADTTLVLWAGQQVPAAPSLSANDACDPDPSVFFSEDTTYLPDGCDYVLTRTWTAVDACGNTTQRSQQIQVDDLCICPDPLVQLVEIRAATCGAADGQAVFDLSLPPEALQGSWLPAFGTFDGHVLSGLPAGNYVFLVDLPWLEGCHQKLELHIPQQSCADTLVWAMTAGSTDTLCLADADVFDFGGAPLSSAVCAAGTSQTVVAGLTSDHCLLLDAHPDFAGVVTLCAVHCFDAGCDTTRVQVVVSAPAVDCDMLQLVAQVQQPSCTDDDGAIALEAQALVGQPLWHWMPAVADGPEAQGLPQGTYYVTVVDAATGCMLADSFVLEAPEAGTLTADMLVLEDVSCPGAADGRIALTDSAVADVWQAGVWVGLTPLSDLPKGDYLLVTAGTACPDSLLVQLAEPAPWSVEVHTQPESCTGADGSIELAVSGANGDFGFVWDPPLSDTNRVANAAADVLYAVTITDAKGCTFVLDSLAVSSDCPLQAPCPQPFASAYMAVALPACTGEASLCLDIPVVRATEGAFLIDGAAWQGVPAACGYDTLVVFSLTDAAAAGQGPWLLAHWQLEDTTLSEVHAATLDELASLAQIVDPDGHWQWLAEEGLLQARRSPEEVGPLHLIHLPTQSEWVADWSLRLSANATRLSLPPGSHELVWFESASGCGDTALVEVVCTETAWVRDTLLQGAEQLYCPEFELADEVAALETERREGHATSLSPQEAHCLSVRAIQPGTDHYRVVAHDRWGVTDTVHYLIHVRAADRPGPRATADSDTVFVGQTLLVDVLANDAWTPPLTQMRVLPGEAPLQGRAYLEGTAVAYEAPARFCDIERLRYELCDVLGCDTAEVQLYVHCPEPRPYTGFSPNGDGINDFFVIEGIEWWPDNSLSVFNRWGEEVYHAHPYRNDWDGTFKGLDLPDGTYFYMLEYGGHRRISGYVQIRR